LFSSELSEMLSISLNSEEVKSRALLVYKHFVPTALFPTACGADDSIKPGVEQRDPRLQ